MRLLVSCQSDRPTTRESMPFDLPSCRASTSGDTADCASRSPQTDERNRDRSSSIAWSRSRDWRCTPLNSAAYRTAVGKGGRF
eukprot:123760-Prymnesium_polylepis.1